MNIFQICSIELAAAVALILAFAVFNEPLVRFERAVVRFVKRVLHR